MKKLGSLLKPKIHSQSRCGAGAAAGSDGGAGAA